MRKSWDDYYMDLAFAVAARGTCLKKKVGCVIVDRNNYILSTGYNGAPARLEHCEEVGCMIENGHCVRTVHAEINAVLQAGKKTKGSKLYVTDRPCEVCSKILLQAGIKKIFYCKEHSPEESKYWLSKIEVTKWKENTT